MEPFSFIIFIIWLCALNVEAQVQISATISPDRDYNAPLDESSMVRFNCTGTEAISQWTVDGIEANTMAIVKRGVTITSPQDIGGGVFFSSLFIPASVENNNTSIQCTTIRASPGLSANNSKLIVLRIQGLLGTPPNLTLSETDNNTLLILRWDAPATLDLTDVRPDILYYIVCHNLTSDPTCVNVSISEKRELSIHSEGDVPMLFTVTAVNVVREGNVSSIIHQPTISPAVPTITTHTTIPG